MDRSSIYKAVKLVSNDTQIESSFLNSFINCHINYSTSNAITVCKRLNKLFQLLCSSKPEMESNKELNSSDYKYLNFWTNFELKREKIMDNETIDSFKHNMENKYPECINIEKLKAALGYIDINEYKRINMLDDLYKNYYEMHEIIYSTTDVDIEECLKYSKNCITKYKEAIRYNSGRKHYFYDALMKFKRTYENLASKAFSKNRSFALYIAKITEDPNESELTFYTIGDNKNKIILISLFGSVIAVVLVLIYFYRVKTIITR
ncbi:hypothetical protein PVMG_04870 [Plasmodium vivax Mauritania I]|uniref:Uncharacterized protein n=2 Tax=Plasmodium vivax TaxID=5855 RepID=A0A0J9VU31_PLAVI|nr:hypothetical protein PVMG_04870 [Plasmodium vivax Mauritania I]KMZ96005.1 hypothetical protein PVNG_02854 [Plasmodium vivax North Korean]